MVTVGIIEDDNKLQKLFIQTLELIGVEVVFAFSSIEEFRMRKANLGNPFIIFLDIGLPGISGLDGISMINGHYPDAHLVVISGNSDQKIIWSAITRGAKGYLIKPIKMESIKQQIQIVIEGGALISPEVGNILVQKVQTDKFSSVKNYNDLTQREKEVIKYLLKGLTYKEVANYMDVASSTINDFVKKIYRKMDVHSKTELLSLFL